MSSDVVLGSALRTNLLSLQRTQSNIDKVQNILATGLKVSSALDNPQNFFAAKGLNDRASDLTRLLDGIGQSVSTIQAADKGATAIGKLVDQADSIVTSAREALEGGAGDAMVTGNIDLSGIKDLTSLAGVSANSVIRFTYTGEDGVTPVPAAVTIEAGDSIEELITKINDIGGSGGQDYEAGEVFEASLDSLGNLQVRSKIGQSFNMRFDAAGTDDAAWADADRAMGTALGFGGIAQRTANGGAAATDGNYEVTALATTKLSSGTFFNATGGFANASDTLVSVRDQDAGAGAARFATTAGTGSGAVDASIRLTVNGSTNIDVALTATTTIQGLVDGINNSSANTGLVKASYDATTGAFSIEATGSNVKTIGTSVVSNSATANRADFDFGVDDALTAAVASGGEGETFVLASAAGTLARLENDYNTVRTQIDELVKDSGYRGTNLLEGDALVTYFNEDRSSKLSTQGIKLNSSGLGLTEANFNADTLNTFTQQILAAKDVVRDFGSAIANSLSIVQTRQDFTQDLIQELEAGADKLTVADQNEEGAKLLALQTRQQLGVTSLSLAVQSQQSVLRLF